MLFGALASRRKRNKGQIQIQNASAVGRPYADAQLDVEAVPAWTRITIFSRERTYFL
jgi:hypothetical protein